MPTPICDIAHEVAVLNDNVRTLTFDIALETFRGNDVVVASSATVAHESAVLNDGAQGNSAPILHESAVLNDAITSRNSGFNIAHEHAVLNDDAGGVAVSKAHESAVLNDVVIALPPVSVAHESAVLNDDVVIRNAGFSVAHESALIGDRLFAQVVATLHESAVLNDAVHQHVLALNIAHESAVLNDAVVQRGGVSVAREMAVLNDAVLQHVSAVDIAIEQFFVNDAIDADGAAAATGAWAAPTDTFAMTRYASRELRSIAVVDGTVLVAGAGGVYALQGADDDGDDIDAHCETGLIQVGVPSARDLNAQNTGDPSLKRASHVYISYQGGPLRFGIGITRSGVEQRYWYDFPDRVADVPVTNRTRLGKGATSGFWRFLLENIDGAGFMVKEQRAVLFPLSRRF